MVIVDGCNDVALKTSGFTVVDSLLMLVQLRRENLSRRIDRGNFTGSRRDQRQKCARGSGAVLQFLRRGFGDFPGYFDKRPEVVIP